MLTGNKLHFVGDFEYPIQVRQLLQQKMSIVYGLPQGAMIQRNMQENPSESHHSTQPKQSKHSTSTSGGSQKLLVEK